MITRILITDDDDSIRSMYSKFLARKGYEVETAASLADMEGKLLGKRFDALVLDVFLPDGRSIDSVGEIRRDFPDMAIILITAEGSVDIAVDAMRQGVDNFLCKPVNLSDLDVFLKKGLEFGSLRRTQIAQQRQARRDEPFFGGGAAWKKTVEMAQVAAENDNVVLLLGETGTGKGVLARWIQEHGRRSDAPFVEINCSALRGEMLASELFGHVKGAFTSAIQDKHGLIEVANGGTLFLDEIGDMDIAVQSQFLKVIEEKTYRRLGEVKTRTSEFRLICATNHDLQEACAEGKFRSDLFFRINTFPVNLPPLRDMKEDLPGLARHLLAGLRYAHGEPSPEVSSLLESYAWPGNIRELRNVLERAMLLARGMPLEAAHFPGLSVSAAMPASPGTLNLDEIERMKIKTAMDRFDGDTRKVAEALGISRATLYRRLKEMKVKLDD